MTPPKINSLILAAIALAGCASGWIGVDGNAVDQDAVAVATTACQVEQKSRMLKNTRAFTDQMKADSRVDADQIERAYAAFVQKTNADIAQCMRHRGLVAS